MAELLTHLRYSHHQSLATQNQLSGFNYTFMFRRLQSTLCWATNNDHTFFSVNKDNYGINSKIKTKVTLSSKLLFNLFFQKVNPNWSKNNSIKEQHKSATFILLTAIYCSQLMFDNHSHTHTPTGYYVYQWHLTTSL